MIKFSGPLLALWNFHPDLLKICSMHTLNLGQLFVCNGAAMMLVCYGLTFLTHFFRVLYCGHTFLCFLFTCQSGIYCWIPVPLGIQLYHCNRDWTQHTRSSQLGFDNTKFNVARATSRTAWFLGLKKYRSVLRLIIFDFLGKDLASNSYQVIFLDTD